MLSVNFFKRLLAQINIGVIANIQSSCFTTYAGITANDGVIQYNIEQVGVRPDDRIFYDGRIDGGALANGYIGSNDGVADIATSTNAYRLNNDRVFICLRRHNAATKLAQQRGIAFQ